MWFIFIVSSSFTTQIYIGLFELSNIFQLSFKTFFADKFLATSNHKGN